MRRIPFRSCPPTPDDAALAQRFNLASRYGLADLRDFHHMRDAVRRHGSAVDAVSHAELDRATCEQRARRAR